MVKVNTRLLPIKAHYLFFMAAMGPILPQLSVLGKQIGISPDIMGYIMSVLPVFYVIAKPVVGFVADYFATFRKMIFLILILVMTISYSAFYFVPNSPPAVDIIDFNANTTNLTFSILDVDICSKELLTSDALCSTTLRANCTGDGSLPFEAYLTNASSLGRTNQTSNINPSHLNLYVCLPPTDKLVFSRGAVFNGTCRPLSTEPPPECLYGNGTFWFFVIVMCIGTIGFNVVNSISDAICFDMLGEAEEHKYGAQRVWGTIGFGASALLAGFAVDFWTLDTVKSFTPALVIMCVFSGLDILSVSKLKLPQFSSSESILTDVWELVKQPAIGSFLIFATIAGIIDSFIIYFMFWHLEDVAAATGYMSQIKLIEGCVVAAECLAGEVPFFFYSGKIIKKLGYVHSMSLCFFFYAVRLALISWIPNPWYLVGVELFFQGCTYALCYTCIVAYASAVAPPGTSATVQGLMAGMDDGLGFSIGSLVGGLAFKRFGGRRSFKYFAIVAICTCIAHILIRPSSRKQQYLPKSGYKAPTEQVAVTSVKDEVKA